MLSIPRAGAVSLLALLAACGGTAPTAAPASSALTHLNIAYSSVSYAQIALPVAEETGIFAKNGLDATFEFGPNGTPALLANQVQVDVTSPEELILADLGGANIVTLGAMVPYLQHKFMVRSEIKSVADLKGKPVGVTKRGNLTETVLRIGLKRGGLDPDKDVQYVEMGSADKQIAGLAAGSIYAASLSPPNNQVAEERAGAHALYDFTQEHLEYPVAQILVQKDWLAKNPNLALALMRSLAQAVALSRSQPDVVQGIYAKWAKTGDDAAKVALKTTQEQVPVRMAPTASGIKAVLDTVAAVQPAAASADPARFLDDSVIKKLDQEGFYKGLPQ